MLGNKQSQKAGDASNLIQADTINVYQGIDEKRAREIVHEQLPEIINAYSREAQSIAEQRITQFADELIPKIVKEQLLETLSDPSVQILLKDAQKSAASSERIEDYSLLSELVIERMKKKADRNVRTGVTQAIKIVDEISDESLLGLTVSHCVATFTPLAFGISKGLETLDSMFSKLIYGKLPQGDIWIDQLDILNAIRINTFGHRKKIEEIYPVILSGYTDLGIKKGSWEYDKALQIIQEANLPLDIICDHELRDGFIRLNIVNLNQINKLSIKKNKVINIDGQQIMVPTQTLLNEQQREAINSVYDLYNKDIDLVKENTNIFMNMWNNYNSLKILREWWNSIPRAFEITCVGMVLAQANAQRCEPTLPNIE